MQVGRPVLKPESFPPKTKLLTPTLCAKRKAIHGFVIHWQLRGVMVAQSVGNAQELPAIQY